MTPATLIYHGVPRSYRARARGPAIDIEAFRDHVIFLKRHARLVSASENYENDPKDPRPAVLLTFDDGLRNHAEAVVPILRAERIPAVFFVCRRNTAEGSYLWFSHLYAIERFYPGKSLKFNGERFDLSPHRRRESIRRLRSQLLALEPHPGAMYAAIQQELPPPEEFVPRDAVNDCYAGMTSNQIREIAAEPTFTVWSHTLDHPLLTLCEKSECERQVVDNKRWIEELTGRDCNGIAYPAGDYNQTVLDVCSRAGITEAYAMDVRLGTAQSLERPRIGIYRPSLARVRFKVRYGMLCRRWGVRIG